ncbi:MAG: HPr family phosphocarrier protein [Rhodobacteraceae bacterium]|nr:HPr family phosphocarrier protein [Paracoccaceae bacterium]
MSAPAVRCRIVNAKGLHARASAKFVQEAERFDAKVTVSKDDYSVNGVSIMGLLLLTASQGSEIEITAEGQDADEALAALAGLVARGFDEI